MISCDDLRLILWKSTRCSMDFKFFLQNWVGLCTELQDITIKRQFPLYSVQILLENQIPRSVRQNSGTPAGFQVEYQGESKDLRILQLVYFYWELLITWNKHHTDPRVRVRAEPCIWHPGTVEQVDFE